ncbi:cell division protein ZapE [Roseibacterium sp. SDUM158017]|uniref:cell division protein ZapE n=1 Tax=Roseicyclus salinarum TaxID=3036773 RepID=UPI002414FE7B|nr:cell division protein ZapE [Roseibacterium sp. SDUM158017]MDG4646891.1 cell division protein ZapE [Roseibacterium sp. SDUM158017]
MGQHLQAIYDTRVAEGMLRPDPVQRAALLRLEELRERLETPERRGLLARFRRAEPAGTQGLYLWGGVGRGKSMLMDLFFAHVGIEAKRRVHFHAFMQEIQAALHEARKTGVDDAIRPVAEAISAKVRLLCFDEMQITDIADAMIVGRLFERLFAAGVVVVTTSNRPPRDLYKDGLNRDIFVPFIALLEERLEVDHLEAMTDYRQDRLAGNPVYFTPLDRAANRALNEIWRDLTHGREEELVLEVKGRQVHLPRYWAGMARCTFWDLCGQPLGPADYLALTGAVKLLVLEDVPQLDSTRFNEARRFVTLIDALYEGHVRLICSAAAEPEKLYVEGEGSFEFARTASRLREMQGADWGGKRDAEA